MVITVSLRNMFFDCPYKFFNFYVRRMQRKQTPQPLQWGSLMHRALAALESVGPESIDLCVAEIRHEAEQGLYTAEDLTQLNEMLIVLPKAVGAYALKYRGDPYTPVELEKEFSVPLDKGHIFRGKVDGIVERDGVFFLKERKTAAKTGESYYERLPRDPQLQGYVAAARLALHYKINNVLYDVIKKPQLYRRVGENSESYATRLGQEYLLRGDELCERRVIPMAGFVEQAYLDEMSEVAEMIEWCIARGTFPQQCAANRIGNCQYQPLCAQGAEGLYMQRPPEELHPELEGDNNV